MHTFLSTAIAAAEAAGALLRENFETDLLVNAHEAHDIKLDLDVRSQELITRILLDAFPEHALYGEEGISGNQDAEYQWIVDPIDGTVNYFYGIPHFCISIALRRRQELLLGVILDPMRRELWTVEHDGSPMLNGRRIQVSPRTRISDAILTVGFSKSSTTIDAGLPLLEKMVHTARKCRMMGSAALDLAYVATGRLDAYIEQGVSLWDIAAGMLLIERAGGKVLATPRPDAPDKYEVVAWNGNMDLGIGKS